MTLEELREKWQSQPIPYLSEEEINYLLEAAITAERMWRAEKHQRQRLQTRLELTECRHCHILKRLFCLIPCPAAERMEER